MPIIEHGNRIPRTLSLNDTLFLRSLSYNKLPQQLLRLSIIKLDGSSFDVQIGSSSMVGELKLAVEEVFSWSPKVGQGKISWSHVWGHFCLCCDGQALVNDKMTIKSLGIKDGDQLKFMRHMSIYHRPAKQSKCHSIASKHYSMVFSGANTHEDSGKALGNDQLNTIVHESNLKNHYEEEEAIPKPKLKFTYFLKGWLSYSKLLASRKKGTKSESRRW